MCIRDSPSTPLYGYNVFLKNCILFDYKNDHKFFENYLSLKLVMWYTKLENKIKMLTNKYFLNEIVFRHYYINQSHHSLLCLLYKLIQYHMAIYQELI